LVCTTYVQPTLTLSAKGGYGLDASGDYTFAEDGTVKLIYA